MRLTKNEGADGVHAGVLRCRRDRRGSLPLPGGARTFLTRIAAASSLMAVLIAAPGMNAADAAQSTEHVELTMTYEFDYLRSLPDGYDADRAKKWPLLVFLHGAGERGRNPEMVKKHGVPKEIEQGRKLPCVVVSPQCPPNERWNVFVLEAFVERMAREHRIDRDRIYLAGLSMGGFGVWGMALSHPERYAAIIAVCGGGESRYAAALKNLPVWAFHGDQDKVVAIERSQEMIDGIRAAGGAPKFTVYPGVGHDSWTATFANDEVYDWLFAQRRPDAVER